VYNLSMKKRKKPNKPYGMRTEAIRKAIAHEVFQDLLKNPHLVVVPKQYKGSRQANKRKAISESL
jgi:hypothetical protein